MNREDSFPLFTIVKYNIFHHGQVGWNMCYFYNEIHLHIKIINLYPFVAGFPRFSSPAFSFALQRSEVDVPATFLPQEGLSPAVAFLRWMTRCLL